ncbi:CAAX protease self-immunity [Pseudarthrobacter equi]|uniref:CAAX protease self-immunity n=1 Tax=Pseudarthrobacter equi TaxID=728066 RepID=A0A1H1YNU9_9MICC|nr:CPBP family intramembrane glutamic endopeptidase [Pseudarthrobacter equi]SDT22766.1 CAAX protease self-immunity [Pseudarthrobacter equi]
MFVAAKGTAPLLAGVADKDGADFIFFAVALPVLVGCILLAFFGWSVGWLREIFARQPISGRGWMWIAVVAVLAFNVLRFATIDYNSAGLDIVATWLLAGLFVGFAEETLTRGFVINLLRRARYREIVVAVTSAAVFAGLHASNLLSGPSLFATAFQVLYTFAFGICMHLAYRLTGRLIVPILLHASTDPSIFLLTEYPTAGPLAIIAGLGNIVVIFVGLLSLFFIRGRVEAPASRAALQTQP